MELSKEDIEFIRGASRDDQVHRYYDSVASKNFKVGDYLIKLTREHDMAGRGYGGWRSVKIHPNSNINKKFKVVHVDEDGVPYVKHLKVNGKLGGIVCLSSLNFDYSKFEYDPEYADHIMLSDGEYDPLKTYKDRK